MIHRGTPRGSGALAWRSVLHEGPCLGIGLMVLGTLHVAANRDGRSQANSGLLNCRNTVCDTRGCSEVTSTNQLMEALARRAGGDGHGHERAVRHQQRLLRRPGVPALRPGRPAVGARVRLRAVRAQRHGRHVQPDLCHRKHSRAWLTLGAPGEGLPLAPCRGLLVYWLVVPRSPLWGRVRGASESAHWSARSLRCTELALKCASVMELAFRGLEPGQQLGATFVRRSIAHCEGSSTSFH